MRSGACLVAGTICANSAVGRPEGVQVVEAEKLASSRGTIWAQAVMQLSEASCCYGSLQSGGSDEF